MSFLRYFLISVIHIGIFSTLDKNNFRYEQLLFKLNNIQEVFLKIWGLYMNTNNEWLPGRSWQGYNIWNVTIILWERQLMWQWWKVGQTVLLYVNNRNVILAAYVTHVVTSEWYLYDDDDDDDCLVSCFVVYMRDGHAYFEVNGCNVMWCLPYMQLLPSVREAAIIWYIISWYRSDN